MKNPTFKKKIKIYNLIILIVLLIYSPLLFAQWEPIQFFGQDLADLTPTSVSFNDEGTIMAAGFERSSQFAGRVIVYSEIDGVWQTLGNPLEGQINSGEFGGEVVLNASGDRLLVSQRSTVDVISDPGGYLVFELNNGTWSQLGNTIELIEGIRFQTFSKSMAMNDVGDRIVVTSGLDPGLPVLSSNVTVFDFDGQDWVQVGNTITSTSNNSNDFFGTAVAISGSGSRIIVGAAGDKDGIEGPVNESYAAIYEFVTDTWQELAIIANPENTVFSTAPVTMSEDGNTISLSSSTESFVNPAPFEFRTRVFETEDGINWIQKGNDILFPFDGDNISRRDIEMNDAGTLMAIPYSVRLPTNQFDGSGLIRIYEFVNNSWQLLDDPIVGNEDVSFFYGEFIALNGTGNRVGIVNFGWQEGNAGGILEIYENNNALSISSVTERNISVFPNPSSNDFNINFGNTPYSGQIKIVDMSGRVAYEEFVTIASEMTVNHTLSTGIYILQLERNNIKLIVK